MNFQKYISARLAISCGIALMTISKLPAAEPAKVAVRSKATTSMAASSKQDKYSFIMFWRNQDQATNAMWKTLQTGLSDKSEKASSVAVNVSDPKEAEFVKRFGVSRAPMPLMLAVAPNGAVTASYARQLDTKRIDEAFVTPTMEKCMLAMQNRKMVLLCVHADEQAAIPGGITGFKKIPCYQKTTEIVQLRVDDPAEVKFLKELEIPQTSQNTITVFMAPPGVLLGKFGPGVTKEQLVSTLVAAGKGCGDKNCKHCKP